MQDSFLNSPLVFGIALTLIHFVWQGALIALVLKTALTFIPHQKSQLRYACASGAMLLNFVAPFITFFIIYKPTAIPFSQQLTTSETSSTIYTHLSSNNGWHTNIVEYFPYLTVLWLCIISVLSLKLFIELYSVTQLPKRNILPPNQELYSRFESLAKEIGLKYTPNLLLSKDTHVPMAIGWLKPIVLLPVSMVSGLTPTQLDMLMLHELAHIRRYDYFINLIQSIVEIILFYHPAVLWVSNQMRNEREFCSDDIAVNHSGNPIAYAHTLADTAMLCNKHRKPSIPNMAMAASGGDLTLRVLRLVNHHHCASSNQVGRWSASLIVIAILLISTSQQLANLLKLEINTVSYTPVVEVIDTPIPTEALVLNNKQSELNIDKPEPAKALTAPNTDINNNYSLSNEIIVETLSLDASDLNNNKEIENKLATTSKVESQLEINESVTNSSLIALPTKSPSEVAFEKTDSKTDNSNNKYAQQLTELSADLNKKPETNKVNPVPEVQPAPATIINAEEPVPTSTGPELIYSINPKYPVLAKRKGIEIEVKVNFIIDKDGYVKNLSFPIVKRHKNYFKNSVRTALGKWRFIPAHSNGKAVESEMSKIFSFSLHE